MGGAIHLVDLIYWLTGEKFIPQIMCKSNKVSRSYNIDFDDFKLSLGVLPSGAITIFSGNYGSQTCHYHEVSIYGTKGVFTHSKGKTFYSFGEEISNIYVEDTSLFPSTHKGDILSEFLYDLINETDTCQVTTNDVLIIMNTVLEMENAQT